MHGVLLVEFAATDRFHRSVRFPYLFGALRRAGVPGRWLRYGVPAAVQYLRGESGVALSSGEIATLVRVAIEFDPEFVVFGSLPAQIVDSALRDALPGARIGVIGGSAVRGENLGAFDNDLSAVVPGDTNGLPDFGYEPANEAARTMQPMPFLSIGPECTYDSPLSGNAYFRNVDLDGCDRPTGCTFCPRPPGNHGPTLDAGDVRRHVEALVSTLPTGASSGQRLSIRLVGEAALQHMEALIDAFCCARFPAADLMFDARPDRLVKSEPRFQRAANLLTGSGHRLNVALVGIESFSRVELARMNKGTTPADNLAAIVTLLRLEHDHPETFCFREHGGLSLILFTPWTVLEDLAFNLQLLRVCALDGICGKVYGSRLRLEPQLAMTALARRDGALVERYEDRAFDTAARNLYPREMPWRFLDPRVEAVCKRLVRLEGDVPFPDEDALAVEVRRRASEAARQGHSRIDLAIDFTREALEEACAAEPSGFGIPTHVLAIAEAVFDTAPQVAEREDTARAILELAVPLAGSPATGTTREPAPLRAQGAAPEDWSESPAEIGDNLLPWLAELSRRGIKPVTKFEPLRSTQTAEWLAQQEFPVVRLRRRLRTPAYEVFLGTDEQIVERAAALTHTIELAPSEPEEAAATAEVGRLLGYPGCCADAFACRPPSARDHYAWAHLERRMTEPGAVEPELNPFMRTLATMYVPCSLRCSATPELVRRELEVTAQVRGTAEARGLREAMSNPWLVMIDGQDLALELRVDGPPGERFRYTPGRLCRWGEPFGLARRADEIVLEDERLYLLKHGRKVGDLSGHAWIWWHGGPMQAPFWKRVLEIRAYQAKHARTANTVSHEQTSRDIPLAQPEPPLAPSMSAFAHLVSHASRWTAPLLPTGCSVEVPEAPSCGRVQVRLVSALTTVELLAAANRHGEPNLFRVGPFAFIHP